MGHIGGELRLKGVEILRFGSAEQRYGGERIHQGEVVIILDLSLICFLSEVGIYIDRTQQLVGRRERITLALPRPVTIRSPSSTSRTKSRRTVAYAAIRPVPSKISVDELCGCVFTYFRMISNLSFAIARLIILLTNIMIFCSFVRSHEQKTRYPLSKKQFSQYNYARRTFESTSGVVYGSETIAHRFERSLGRKISSRTIEGHLFSKMKKTLHRIIARLSCFSVIDILIRLFIPHPD